MAKLTRSTSKRARLVLHDSTCARSAAVPHIGPARFLAFDTRHAGYEKGRRRIFPRRREWRRNWRHWKKLADGKEIIARTETSRVDCAGQVLGQNFGFVRHFM
jgi:hypothetical protein